MSTIRLRTLDDQIFEVDIKVAKMSETIRIMLNDMGEDDEIIRIPKIHSSIMKWVVDYSNHHVNDVPEEESDEDSDSNDSDDDAARARRSDDIDPWDQELMRPLSIADIFELILAANYLNIKGLLTLVSKTIANMIKGKTPQQIRQMFNLDRPPRGNACG